MCISSIISIIVFLFFKGKEGSRKWQCIERVPDKQYIVGKLNENGDSVCMYDPDNVGCYVIVPEYINDKVNKTKLKADCDAMVKQYPKVTIPSRPDDDPVALATYSCGASPSTNYTLYGSTGYENETGTCNKIYNEKSITNEAQKYVNTIFFV